MKIISVNLSAPLEVVHKKKTIRTGIFKKAVAGPVYAAKYNLAGDGQADLKNHGGEYKAVYAYSYDHYAYWSERLKRRDFEYGQFGENLTVSGLDETQLCIGDQLQAGQVIMTITQPRVPCFKLSIKFADPHMPRKFMASAMTGCYLRVLQEGYLQAGDELCLIKAADQRITVKQLFSAYYLSKGKSALDILKRVLQEKDLSPSWRRQIEERLTGG
jgi:MOSC domain-containing protein YiiM